MSDKNKDKAGETATQPTTEATVETTEVTTEVLDVLDLTDLLESTASKRTEIKGWQISQDLVIHYSPPTNREEETTEEIDALGEDDDDDTAEKVEKFFPTMKVTKIIAITAEYPSERIEVEKGKVLGLGATALGASFEIWGTPTDTPDVEATNLMTVRIGTNTRPEHKLPTERAGGLEISLYAGWGCPSKIISGQNSSGRAYTRRVLDLDFNHSFYALLNKLLMTHQDQLKPVMETLAINHERSNDYYVRRREKTGRTGGSMKEKLMGLRGRTKS